MTNDNFACEKDIMQKHLRKMVYPIFVTGTK